jgi:hypothetical protein
MLDFLASVTISDEEASVSGRKGGPRKERNPEGLAIRVFKDGSVYPSSETVATFDLEYKQAVLKEKIALPLKEGETEVKYSNRFEVEGGAGNGFDVIDTEKYPAFKLPEGNRLLIISAVSKTSPKVDLFGSTTYEDNGTPKSDVLSQGAKTFGKEELIGMIEDVYGVIFAKGEVEGVDFVDLVLVANPVTGKPWNLPNPTFIPKRVSRGKDAGSYSVSRRENAVAYALIPKQFTAQPTVAAPAKAFDAEEIVETDEIEA